jgi:putative sigma-54 modulation protein
MDVRIQSVHFDADGKLTDFVTKKLEKLKTFHDRIVKVDVFLKLDNVAHAIKDKVAEIRVRVPRHDFFVKVSSKSFEESFESALEAIISQIKRKKEKLAA